MSQDYGREIPPAHAQRAHRPVSRYLVVIGAGTERIARLLLDSRVQVQEFDAGAGEVADLIHGLSPTIGAGGPEWDRALSSHSAAERAAAVVYRLEL